MVRGLWQGNSAYDLGALGEGYSCAARQYQVLHFARGGSCLSPNLGRMHDESRFLQVKVAAQYAEREQTFINMRLTLVVQSITMASATSCDWCRAVLDAVWELEA